MFSALAVLVYVCAFAIPLLCLYRYHAAPWPLHLLAILAAAGMGIVQVPADWHTALFDIAFGAVFVLLAVWGIGGLVAFHHHHEKHA